MEQNRANSAKNLFSAKKEIESIKDELKVSKILDKEGGIFSSSRNGSGFDTKNSLFGGLAEENIFETKDASLVNKSNKKPAVSDKSKGSKASRNSAFEPEFLESLNLNRSAVSSELGNKFDQIG